MGLAQDKRLRTAPALVFLFDRFHGAQLVFPGPLQRARHQPVLGLDRVVLAPGPLGFVAGALAPQCPLFLQPVRFLLQLPESSDGDGDPVGCEGVEKRALDKDIDGECTHFLAQRAGLVVAVGAAAIDRIVALRAFSMADKGACLSRAKAWWRKNLMKTFVLVLTIVFAVLDGTVALAGSNIAVA